jgi:hypothetical protein
MPDRGELEAEVRALGEALEGVLRRQLACHARLLELVHGKREAIRTADVEKITRLCRDEEDLLCRAAALEKEREQIAAAAAKAGVAAPRGERLRAADIAERLEEPGRSRVHALAAQVREAVTELRRQSSIVRAAAESLSAHMAGILQVIQGAMSQARVYGRKGRIAVGAPVQSAVDLRS